MTPGEYAYWVEASRQARHRAAGAASGGAERLDPVAEELGSDAGVC
jgi:hypothetical protein